MTNEHLPGPPKARPPGLMIVGTDTGVGKTYVGSLIVRACRAQGLRVGVYKPVASGCSRDAIDASDAWQLWDAADRPESLHDVCPQSFAAPLSPHLAARQEGRVVDEDLLLSGLQAWQDYELVVVEGVGGLMTPLSDDLYVADLACAIGYPLVVVAPNRLGVINQTLQTLITATTFRDGLDVAGIVLNEIAPDDAANGSDASRSSNAAAIEERCVPPLLAHVRWAAKTIGPPVDWLALANRDDSHLEQEDLEELPD